MAFENTAALRRELEHALPERPFTDPERTGADAKVMDRMLQRLRREARSWPAGRTSVEMLKYTRAGCRHWPAVRNWPPLLSQKNRPAPTRATSRRPPDPPQTELRIT